MRKRVERLLTTGSIEDRVTALTAMESHYRDKIMLFEKWWTERGYPDGIPDEVDYALEQKRLVPSWRRVCRTLLRNDYWCKGLGFSQQKSAAYTKYRQMVAGRRQRWNVPEKALGYTQELLDIGAGN